MTFLDQVLLSVMTSLLTAFAAYFGFLRKAKVELMKDYETRFNEKRWDAYIRLVRLFPRFGAQYRSATCSYNDQLTPESKIRFLNLEKEIDHELNEIEAEILLIGSDKVLYAFILWRIYAHQFSFYDDGALKLRTDMINAMRFDLGKTKSLIDNDHLEELKREFLH